MYVCARVRTCVCVESDFVVVQLSNWLSQIYPIRTNLGLFSLAYLFADIKKKMFWTECLLSREGTVAKAFV